MSRPFWFSIWAASAIAGAAVWLLAAEGTARAEQFGLLDISYTHERTSHKAVKPSADAPSNWRAPVNYAEGTAYVRVEVMTKPSDVTVNYEICFISGAAINGSYYGCLGAHRFTAPTVLNYSVRLPSMWQYQNVDWSKPLREITLIVKDSGLRLVDRADPAFYPMQIRTTITIVSSGASLADGGVLPRADAGAGAAGDARADRTVPGGDSAPAPDTQEPPDPGGAGGSTAGGAGGSSGSGAGSGGRLGGGAGAGGAARPAPTGGSSGDEEPASGRHATSGGCSVGGATNASGWGLWMAVAALSWRARCRRGLG